MLYIDHHEYVDYMDYLFDLGEKCGCSCAGIASTALDNLRVRSEFRLITLEHPCGDIERFLVKNKKLILRSEGIDGCGIGMTLGALGIEYIPIYERFEDENKFWERRKELINAV